MASLTAAATASRAALSSEKRTTCFVGWTFTSTRRGAAGVSTATGGGGRGGGGGGVGRARVPRGGGGEWGDLGGARRGAAGGDGRAVGVGEAADEALGPDEA